MGNVLQIEIGDLLIQYSSNLLTEVRRARGQCANDTENGI